MFVSSRDESNILCKMFVSSRDESNFKGRIFRPSREELRQFGVVEGSCATLTESCGNVTMGLRDMNAFWDAISARTDPQS